MVVKSRKLACRIAWSTLALIAAPQALAQSVDNEAATPLPPLASPGMLVPAERPDGTYPTPNEHMAGAAAVWHLRAALNVAALSCPGEQGARITTAYNGFVTGRRATLQQVYLALGGDAADAGMTQLYNYYAQLPARAGFCAAAEAAAAELTATGNDQLEDFSMRELVVLDQPFRDFYRAYDAWRQNRPVVIAVAAVAPAQVR